MRALAIPLRRPIGAGAVYAAIFVLGLAALPGLPLGLAPDLEYPRLTVSFTWTNASPESMEALVTSRIESGLVTLPGAHEVTSVSEPGRGRVDVSFERGTKMDLVEVLAREHLAILRDDLPPELDPPVVERSLPREMDPGAFFVFQVAGDRTPEALRTHLEDRILPRLAGIPGVSSAAAYGGSRPEIRVDLARDAVERGLVRPLEARDALDRIGGRRSLGVRVADGLRVPVALERPVAAAAAARETVLPGRAALLTLAEVASVRDGWEEPRTLARLDGRPSVQGVLEREAGSNVLQVAAAVREALVELESALPPGLSLRIVHDESETIREEIAALARRSALSLVLIFGVLALSRRSVRAPAVVLAAVLFSALATFLLFRFAGLGINLVTLSGLALAFGMAVDNSIVLLENVALRTRSGHSPLKTLAATREVLFPLLAATSTTAVVIMPFLYLAGDLRDYYLPFVLAVGLSLTASLFVALTLIPLLARWSLASRRGQPATGARISRPPSRLFERVLSRLLRRPWIPVSLSLAVLGASLWVFETRISRGSIFQPEADTTLRVGVVLPPGAEIARTDALIRSFEDLVLEHEFTDAGYVEQVEAFVMEDRASLSARFHPQVARTAIPQVLKEELTLRAAAVSGADVSVLGQGPGFSRSSAKVSPSYQLRLRGPDYLRLGELAEAVGELLGRNRRIRDVDTNATGFFIENARELALVPDRERLAELGASMWEIVDAVAPAVAAEVASRRYFGPEGEIGGRIRYADDGGFDAAGLLDTLVRTEAGVAFPLGEVLRLEERKLPGEIRRRDQRYERAISFEYRGPRRVGDRFVRALVESTDLPSGYSIEDGLGVFLTGEEERQIAKALVLALVLVAMVSAALFESLLLPLVALVSIPLSFAAIPFTFWATGESFDRTAYVGLILLAGIAINNALLLVHRAGRIFRRSGRAREAARRAAVERMRPILLTTATSVAGLVPLLWEGNSAGAATWRSLALSATAGLLASALFTLLIVPCLFTILAREPRSQRAGSPSTLEKGVSSQ